MKACGDSSSSAGFRRPLPAAFGVQAIICSSWSHRPSRLFDNQAHERTWAQFAADGFKEPGLRGDLSRFESSVLWNAAGGISTVVSISMSAELYGFSSIFNPWSNCPAVEDWRMPRKPQLMVPLLGLSVGETVWVLTAEEIVRGGPTRGLCGPVLWSSCAKERRHDPASFA